jgi:hypothetical protein
MVKRGKKITREINFAFEIESNRIKHFVINENDRKIEAREIATS